MKQATVLEKAILSEKAYQQMTKGIYTFLVSGATSKNDIKNQVEKLFSVKVLKVNVLKVSPKQKKIAKTRKTVLVGGAKKAVVYLKAGQIIAALSPKTEAKVKKAKNTKEKDIQIESVEGKEG